MCVRVFVCVLYSCPCTPVWAFRQCVLVQRSIKLTELETSDRAEEHVVHIPSIHNTHRFPECLKL